MSEFQIDDWPMCGLGSQGMRLEVARLGSHCSHPGKDDGDLRTSRVRSVGWERENPGKCL